MAISIRSKRRPMKKKEITARVYIDYGLHFIFIPHD
jgi:hypothetical protein